MNQVPSWDDVSSLEELAEHISRPRLQRYMVESKDNLQNALRLYRWNASLCQSLYWSLQTAEIVTRNGICRTLEVRYGPDWIRNPKFLANARPDDRDRIKETIQRQRAQRRVAVPSTDQVVADLSFGLWVSFLTRHYSVPLKWPTNLPVSFPGAPQTATIDQVRALADGLRRIRNRVAHHEPLIHLPMAREYQNIMLMIKWASPPAHWFVGQTCAFPEVWEDQPTFDHE